MLTWSSAIPNISPSGVDGEVYEAMQVKAGVIIDAAWKAREKADARGEEWHLNSEYVGPAVTVLEKLLPSIPLPI